MAAQKRHNDELVEDLNSSRGRGEGSRMSFTTESSLSEGWTFKRMSPKYCLWFNDHGKRYRSSLEVEAALREQGFLANSESDSDFEPSQLKKTKLDRW